MKLIDFTEEQKNLIVNEWNSRKNNPPSLKELIQLVFPDNPNVDGRGIEGKSIQAFLATKNLKAHGRHIYVAKEKIILNEEQKEFVRNNKDSMTPVEMARVLFSNNLLTNLNQETRSVIQYFQEINPPKQENEENLDKDPDESLDGIIYKPVKSLDKLIHRVNRYIFEANFKKDSLSGRSKKNLESLLKYLNTYRFNHQINTYENKEDKILFESSFVRYTYDKDDLTEEEVDQYILLCTEVVISSSIQRRSERLQRLLDDASDNQDPRISMGLVEAINTAQTEYNSCVSRQQKILGDLKQKRSDRIGTQLKQNASIINLVQLWKEEESRQKMIRLAQMKKKTLAEDVQKMSSMDEIKCRILGISEEEILNG